jgi:flagellar motility protein MotE (MotC chaperone)
MDPRVSATTRDLQQQFDLEMKLASAVTESSKALMQMRSLREQIGNLLKAGNADVKALLTALDDQLADLSEDNNVGRNGAKQAKATAVNTDLIALYKAIDSADAAPTVAQLGASNKAESDLADLLGRWRKVQGEIPPLNQKLSASGLPALQLDLPPQEQGGGEDQE